MPSIRVTVPFGTSVTGHPAEVEILEIPFWSSRRKSFPMPYSDGD